MDENRKDMYENQEAETQQNTESQETNGGLGVVIGAALGVVGIVGTVLFATRKKRKAKKIEKAMRTLEKEGYDVVVPADYSDMKGEDVPSESEDASEE